MWSFNKNRSKDKTYHDPFKGEIRKFANILKYDPKYKGLYIEFRRRMWADKITPVFLAETVLVKSRIDDGQIKPEVSSEPFTAEFKEKYFENIKDECVSESSSRKNKGGIVPNTTLGVAVKYSEETARINPQMIVNEFERIIKEKDDRIFELESISLNTKVFFPSNLLMQEDWFHYTKDIRRGRQKEKGYLIPMHELENLITKNHVIENSRLEENSSMDLIEYISKKEEHDILLAKIYSDKEVIEKELFNFRMKFIVPNRPVFPKDRT